MKKWLQSLFGRPNVPSDAESQPTSNLGCKPQESSGPSVHSLEGASVGLLDLIHRLSQPLTSLRGSLELALANDQQPSNYPLILRQTIQQADFLVAMLVSLRELVEAEEPGDQSHHFRMGTLAKEVVEELRPLADSRGINMIVETGDRLYVRADASRMRGSLFRIICHAINRTPDGGTVLVLLSSTHQKVCMMVADEGSSFEPHELAHLSLPYSIGQLFSEASKQGTLEWAIAKRSFEAQGASVRVERRLGKGCGFGVYFPAYSSPALQEKS